MFFSAGYIYTPAPDGDPLSFGAPGEIRTPDRLVRSQQFPSRRFGHNVVTWWSQRTSAIAPIPRNLLKNMARPTGFEPVAPAFGELNLSNVSSVLDRRQSVCC